MGTYTELTVAEYPLISSKSEVVPELMTVFRESDRRVFVRRLSDRSRLVWGAPDPGDDQESEAAIEYSCETSKAIDRLEVMGFGLRRARRDFEAGRQLELEKYSSWAEEHGSEWFAERREFVKGLTFDVYAHALMTVITNGLRPVPFDDRDKEGLDPTVKYILGHNDDNELGFLGNDLRLLLRLACEVVEPDTRLVQDITALVHAGYYGSDEPVCEHALLALTAGHSENAPRIILTEGATDGAVLKSALEILYPHLAEYYSFLDFDASRSPGGAGSLVSVVKAFAGAGITNRIIALFDNDTAAREATRALSAVPLPGNIVVRHYPELALLRNYPTLGPSGLSSLDVNGMAASIELYLGEDILRDSRGELIPIQWRGYSQALNQFQGEVVGKGTLRDAFRRKVERCRVDRGAIGTNDWSGVMAILEVVFHAFDEA